jgi:hypothetical protein
MPLTSSVVSQMDLFYVYMHKFFNIRFKIIIIIIIIITRITIIS